MLGGKNYVNILVAILLKNTIKAPLKGCAGIGYMMGRVQAGLLRQRGSSEKRLVFLLLYSKLSYNYVSVMNSLICKVFG